MAMNPQQPDNNLVDWQIRCKKVKKRTMKLYFTKEWSDCTFQFDACDTSAVRSTTVTIEAHKLILAMSSPVFAAQFYGSLNQEGPIHVTDIDRHSFSAMLRYIYTDAIDIFSIEEAINIYYAAKKYILPFLQDHCTSFIYCELNPTNVCRVYEFACFHDETLLKQKCLKMFRKKTLDVLKSSNFVKANLETLKQICSMDSLNIRNELDLFSALLTYRNFELENKEQVKKISDALCLLFKKHSSKLKEKLEVKRTSEARKESPTGSMCDKNMFISCDSCSEDTEVEDRRIASTVVVPSSSADNCSDISADNMAESFRLRLRPCVQELRFLTLTPLEFAECKQLTDLLTKEEIMAIAMNIASKDTSVLMPNGFSKSLVPRNQLANTEVASIHFTVNNIVKAKKFTSDVFCARKVPWSVTVLYQEKRKRSRNEKQANIRLYLNCLLQKDTSWSCAASYSIKAQPFSPGCPALTQKEVIYNYTFSNEKSRATTVYPFGNGSSMHHPLADNSITFEVCVSPQDPVFIQ